MDACFTCEVNAAVRPTPGGPIFADGTWVADHGIPPILPGYVVLKPRRHVPDLADLTPEEAAGLGTVSRSVMAAIRAALQPERIYVCSFVESVPQHLHFHLLPRYATMPPLGPGLLERIFAGEWAVSEGDAATATNLIRAQL
jgi:histidine triad (HIT) family protein